MAEPGGQRRGADAPSDPGGKRQAPAIAVVIPCYRVLSHVDDVLRRVGPEVGTIYCVDDACPDQTGQHLASQCADPRVVVLRHDRNRGVGAATKTGYRRALEDGADVIIKLDGDGQMDPRLIPRFVAPISNGRADYTKGNRFFRMDSLHGMPAIRKLGNAMLSLLTKLSSGYWVIFDPANGYTAIHSKVLRELPLDKISDRWFFESDMLFRLNTLTAVIEEVPLDSIYAGEISNLRIRQVLPEFIRKHTANFCKRLLYGYFLRNFSLASLQLVVGLALLVFGVIFGSIQWWSSISTGIPVSSGTVMLAALTTLVGVQFLLSFLAHDMSSQPRVPLHLRL